MFINVDATLRASQYDTQEDDDMHKTIPLHEFIQNGLTDPENSGNCLDSPGLRAEIPPFIA